MSDLEQAVMFLAGDVGRFAELGGGLRLREYQAAVARAVTRSVVRGEGLTFVVMFPRQSGKNEVQAQIEAFVLARFMTAGGEIVKISPTWKPQSVNAMERLERALKANFLTREWWSKERGYIYKVGKARMVFLSGSPSAHIVGATASLLLEVDEAQDVEIGKFDKEIAPMAAAGNATRVLWGTAWTSETLLARELETGLKLEAADGRRRVFRLGAGEVAAESAGYGVFVAEQVRRLGRNHPMVRTQYFSETVDETTRLFPAERRALMQGQHARLEAPVRGEMYALLLDVAGEEEAESLTSSETRVGRVNERRDSTALTVVRVQMEKQAAVDEFRAVYEVVRRYAWTGIKQGRLLGELREIGHAWGAWRWVVDATGIGAGTAGFLEEAFAGRVRRFTFSLQSKSKLGWDFLGIVETGRYREYAGEDALQSRFWREAGACEFRVGVGPEKVLQWGVPDGRRDGATGEVVHDDLLVSAMLCARLEGEAVGGAASAILPGTWKLDPIY